jgi:hypothetical protein
VPSRYPNLARHLVGLVEAGSGAALAAALDDRLDALRTAVLAENQAFRASGNPDILPALDRHLSDHLAELRRLFSSGEVRELEHVRAHARWLAGERFPLEALIEAYRTLRDAILPWLCEASRPDEAKVAPCLDELNGIMGSIAAAEYVDRTRTIAEAEGDRRTELLNILLSGYDESDARVAQILKRAGYLEQRQAYCVAVAQSTNSHEMDNPARVQRIVAAVSEIIAGTAIRALIGVRSNVVVAVLSDKRRQSGWTAPQTNLADRIRPLLLGLGPAVLVGVSTDHPSTSFLPRALHQATIALEFADVAERVVHFSDLPIRDLLVHHGTDYIKAAPPAWLSSFLGADAKAEGSLLETLRALADADLNMQKAARALRRHPNTVYTRLERIRDLTGLDGQRYRDLTELLLAADCWGS